MPRSTAEKLYSPTLLALSASLSDYALKGTFDATADARSRTCGSTITIGLNTASGGLITAIGMQVSACAVGQSSAALLAQGVRGKSAKEVAEAYEQVSDWLAGHGDLPDWPGFEALIPALPHTGRHEALLLPWKAAVTALSTGTLSR